MIMKREREREEEDMLIVLVGSDDSHSVATMSLLALDEDHKVFFSLRRER